MRCQQVTVDKGTVGRLVLDHDGAILIDVYTEMDVADTLQRVIGKDEIASCRVAPKNKACRRVLELRRETKDNGVTPDV